MKTHVYIAQSLDGFIADKHGNLDWLSEIPNPDNDDFGFADFLDKVDAIVMGRNTFEKILTFGMWPYPKPVYVISSTLKVLPQEYSDKAEILNFNPYEILEKLQKYEMENIYVDGGVLIQGFLSADLIDELIITTIPILLGGGISLFGEMEKPLRYKLHKSEILLNSMVKNYYIREGKSN